MASPIPKFRKPSPRVRFTFAFCLGIACAALARDPLTREGIRLANCPHLSERDPALWPGEGGNWIDSKGQRNGNEPFSRALVKPGHQFHTIEWEITALVKSWLDRSIPNDGIVLRSLDARTRSISRFWSETANDPSFRPSLRIKHADGSTSHTPLRFTLGMDCSAPSEEKASQLLIVSRAGPGLVLADSPANAKGGIAQVFLRFVTTDKQFGEAAIGVFRYEPAPDKTGKKPQLPQAQ
jgi:hypothetical protein